MNTKVEIITDEAGNKKSVVMPYPVYEQLIAALTAHNETMDKLKMVASILAQAQESRTEALLPTRAMETPKTRDLLGEIPEPAEAPKAPEQEIRSYQRARGYFTETGGFWVLAGSVARFSVSNAFDSVESLFTLRRKLIDEGVLGSNPDFPDYVFTRDCYFNSASAAACIIDGNSRNNPAVWKKK